MFDELSTVIVTNSTWWVVGGRNIFSGGGSTFKFMLLHKIKGEEVSDSNLCKYVKSFFLVELKFRKT